MATMKKPKRGRPRMNPIKRAERDFRIIGTYAFHRRQGRSAKEAHWDIVIKRLYRLHKEKMSPRAAIRQVAVDLGIKEQRVKNGIARKFNAAEAVRSITAKNTRTSISEVARVLADQERDTGELIPDD